MKQFVRAAYRAEASENIYRPTPWANANHVRYTVPMYVHDRSRIKRIGVDVMGVLCIVASGLTGWLPGPGGIPLLIIGLSLLATNHEWAERLLLNLKNNGHKLSEKLFDGSRRVRWAVDLGGIVIIALAVYILSQFTRNTARTAAVSCFLLGITLLAANRRRYSSIKKKLHKH